MTHSMKSGLADYITGMVEQKRALGYKYESQEYQLWRFDQFCIQNYPHYTELTKEIAMHWAERKGEENKSTQEGRISPIRQLAKYIYSMGKTAFMIPRFIPGKAPRYIPHIYTDYELKLFFQEADQFSYDKRYPERHLVMSVIFRLIYCCGLRQSEARNLRMEDVDLENGILRILNSKSRSRFVPLSEDVHLLCRRYNNAVAEIYPSRSWFFENRHGVCYTDETLGYMFHQCWHRTGIEITNGNPPRIHDFRHSFSIRRLNLWVKEGKDINAFLPYLSMYLGHKTFVETDYYLHLTSDFYPVLKDKSTISESLIPEVDGR